MESYDITISGQTASLSFYSIIAPLKPPSWQNIPVVFLLLSCYLEGGENEVLPSIMFSPEIADV